MSERQSRRAILRKSAYVVPTVLTLAIKPSFASSGSGRCDSEYDREGGKEWEGGNSNYEREAKKAKEKEKEKKH